MTYDITTVGTASIDIFLELENIQYGNVGKEKIPCFGLPVGQKILVSSHHERFGGNAANTAIGMSLLRNKVAIVSSTDTCPRCKTVILNLEDHHVATRYLCLNKQAEVNLSYILDWQKNKHDRIILSYHQPKDFSRIHWPQTRYIYLTSLGMYFKDVIKQLPPEPRLIVNPGMYEIKRENKHLLGVLRKTDLLIVNKSEAARILSVDESTKNIDFLLINLLKLGPKASAVTDGASGAFAMQENDHDVYFEKGMRVDVQEVTGAGDAFSSGFVSAYLRKRPLQECLRWGILNSTSCIQKIGAQEGLLSLRNLKKEYLKRFY